MNIKRILTLCLLPLCCLAQTNTKATLEETSDFLIAKFELSSKEFETSSLIYRNQKIEIDGCECRIDYTELYRYKNYEGGTDTSESEHIISFSFADLIPTISIESHDNGLTVMELETYLSKKVIEKTVLDQESIKKKYFKEVSKIDFMWTYSNNLSKRITSALLRIIELCGGKKEKF